MLQSGQQQMNFFNDSHDQVPDIPSHMYHVEDQNPLFQNQQNQDTQTDSTRQQTKKREHTVPKLLLSVMHKILYWQSSTTTKLFQQLLCQLNKKHNNSTALKFIMLAKKAELISVLKTKFDSQATQHLNMLCLKKSWTQTRFISAVQWKIRISKALNSRSINNTTNIIWQGHNHKNKFSESINNVNAFKSKLKRIRKNQLRKSS